MGVFKAYNALFGVKNLDIGIYSFPSFLNFSHPTDSSSQNFRTETRFGHSESYIAVFAPKNINIAPK